ncbi:hypothetical protein [Mycolicibacterium conceptionense]|uniref:hypothetical protein n=1 Tax=Mycolicibacterium conceptionense TaxID=451644 RepID=UPI0013A554D7|nr:hypothetical protein [Mycolicibacterium conceptionense]
MDDTSDRLLNYASLALGAAFSVAGQFLPRWASWPFFVVSLAILSYSVWQFTKRRFLRGPFGGSLERFSFGEYETRWGNSPSDVRTAARLMLELAATESSHHQVLQELHQRIDRCIRLIEPTSTSKVVVRPLFRARSLNRASPTNA